MREAIDLYLATAPLGEVLTYVGLGILAVGFGPFVPGHVAEHIAAYRASR
ncbi:hypothetical protein ACLBYG_22180 [Methylobacterium sp. D53M]